jgi:RNA polymerase sigma-70 factor (ECF subfamily)
VVVDRFRSAAARPKNAQLEDWQLTVDRRRAHEIPDFPEEMAIADLLRNLPQQRREAFVLTQLLGLSYAEAAQTVGCPVGTIRSRVARARESLITLLRAADALAPRAAGDSLRVCRPTMIRSSFATVVPATTSLNADV